MNLNYPSDFEHVTCKHPATDREIQDLISVIEQCQQDCVLTTKNVVVVRQFGRIYIKGDYYTAVVRPVEATEPYPCDSILNPIQ